MNCKKATLQYKYAWLEEYNDTPKRKPREMKYLGKSLSRSFTLSIAGNMEGAKMYRNTALIELAAM
jgi:hypothetical protein